MDTAYPMRGLHQQLREAVIDGDRFMREGFEIDGLVDHLRATCEDSGWTVDEIVTRPSVDEYVVANDDGQVEYVVVHRVMSLDEVRTETIDGVDPSNITSIMRMRKSDEPGNWCITVGFDSETSPVEIVLTWTDANGHVRKTTKRIVLSWQLSSFVAGSTDKMHVALVFPKVLGNRISRGDIVKIGHRFMGWSDYDQVASTPDGLDLNDVLFYPVLTSKVPRDAARLARLNKGDWRGVNKSDETRIILVRGINRAVEVAKILGDVRAEKQYTELRRRGRSRMLETWQNFEGLTHQHVMDADFLGAVYIEEDLARMATPIQLIGHFSIYDLTTLRKVGPDRHRTFKGRMSRPSLASDDPLDRSFSAGGGVVSGRWTIVREWDRTSGEASNQSWSKIFVGRFIHRDSKTHTSPGKGKLWNVGESVGIPKVELEPGEIEEMETLLEVDPLRFVTYSGRDAVIPTVYACFLYGHNRLIPATLGGAAATAAAEGVAQYLGVEDSEQFEAGFRGLYKPKKGLESHGIDELDMFRDAGLEPLNAPVRHYLGLAAFSFRGGTNNCSRPGYYSGVRLNDFDLAGAYLSSMSMVKDVDWSRPPTVIRNRRLRRRDFKHGAMTPIVGGVTFSTPAGVEPCLPVYVDGTPIYPRSSGDLPQVYLAGPELFDAVCAGVKVYAVDVVRMKPLKRDVTETEQKESAVELDGHSYSMRATLKTFVEDRARVTKINKDHPFVMLLKLAGNAIYGKTGQAVSGRKVFDAYSQEMKAIGMSAITCPYRATMCTSFVRAVLTRTRIDLEAKGYRVFSITTDGFITDASKEDVEGLKLNGLADIFMTGRQALVGEREMWEIKHTMTTLLNQTTRLNVSLETGDEDKGIKPGVLAMGSMYIRGTDEERRAHTMHNILAREGSGFPLVMRSPSSLKDVAVFESMRRQDFAWTETTVRMKLNFDFKFQPLWDEIEEQWIESPVDGELYPVCSFGTQPWDTPEQYFRVRELLKSSGVIKTAEDFADFKACLDNDVKRMPTPIDIARSIITGHRLGMDEYHVPAWDGEIVDGSKMTVSVKAKIKAVSWALGVICTESDWNNARRPNRQSSILPMTGSMVTAHEKVCEQAEKYLEWARDHHPGVLKFMEQQKDDELNRQLEEMESDDDYPVFDETDEYGEQEDIIDDLSDAVA